MFFRSQALNYEAHWEVLSIPGQGSGHVIPILMIICWCIDPAKRNKGGEKLYPTQASSEHQSVCSNRTKWGVGEEEDISFLPDYSYLLCKGRRDVSK